jgi:glutamate-1-semialdehyde 2,1-aminomutase
MEDSLALSVLALGLLTLVPAARRRIELSRAKHRSLAGHSRLARRVAGLIPGCANDDSRFFSSDGAPDDVAGVRRLALVRLGAEFARR